jgi:hypothetical protein
MIYTQALERLAGEIDEIAQGIQFINWRLKEVKGDRSSFVSKIVEIKKKIKEILVEPVPKSIENRLIE